MPEFFAILSFAGAFFGFGASCYFVGKVVGYIDGCGFRDRIRP